MNLLEVLKKFFSKNLVFGKPVLFAYSGGVDSSCLLDLILKCRDEMELDLHIVHVNHGWREESDREAQIIKEKLKPLNICFHYKKFEFDCGKNIENALRNKRIEFFESLYKKYNYQALILAHQKDDLAETVLKRVLEGANLFSVASMQESCLFKEMVIWRPLLKVSRKLILDYLQSNNIEYFLDKTNENVKYLRAKMRKDILPHLQKNFNKEIIDNLVSLSINSLELDDYLKRRTKSLLENFTENSFGSFIDLNESSEILEIKYIIKQIAFSKNIEISRPVLNLTASWIREKKPNLRLQLKNAAIYADRGHLFVFKNEFKPFKDKTLLTQDSLDFGPWKVIIRKNPQNRDFCCWKEIFKDQINIYVPEDKYFIHYPSQNKRLKKNWENSKVPSFLRRIVPVISNDNNDIYDFLSGKKLKLNNKNILQISLKLK